MQWMRVMAAQVTAAGGQLATSKVLWSEIARQAEDQQVRRSALEHLAAIQAKLEMNKLEELLAVYASRQGKPAGSLQALVAAGYLRALPRDPSGTFYLLDPGGRVRLNPRSSVDLSLLQ